MITRHRMKLLKSTAEGMREGKKARMWSQWITFETGQHHCEIHRVHFDKFFNRLTIQFACKLGKHEIEEIMRKPVRQLTWMNVPFLATAFVKTNGILHSNAYIVHATVNCEPRRSLFQYLSEKFRK